MKTEKKIHTSIDPVNINLLGVVGKYLFIRDDTAYFDDTEETFSVVIKIKESEFNKLFKKYVEAKRDYCKRYNHFCGVHGHYYSEDVKQIGEIDVIFFNMEGDELVNYYKDVPLIEVIEWSDPDMEHG